MMKIKSDSFYQTGSNASLNIVATHPVSIRGLGDALQYCVMAKLFGNAFPNSQIKYICLDIQELSLIADMPYLGPQISDTNFSSTSMIKKIFIQRSKIKPRKIGTASPNLVKPVNANLERLIGHYLNSSKACKYVLSSYFKHNYSFDAGMMGGHTICCDLDYFGSQYYNLRSAVKGPIVLSPISLSSLSIEYCARNDKAVLRRLKQSLESFDHIFVRGPYSFRLIKEELKVNTNVTIALDQGFGVKLLYKYREFQNHQLLATEATHPRIIIIPRLEFFNTYNKSDFSKPYLETLTGFIKWLFEKADADVYLATQVVNDPLTSALSGIDEIVNLLEKKLQDNNCFKRLHVYHPTSIVDAYNFYSSANLVVSSYMHGGIIALSSGVPAIFVAPLTDTKILDNLAILNLDPTLFLLDMFSLKDLNSMSLIGKAEDILENLSGYSKMINSSIKHMAPTLYQPAETMAKLYATYF